MHPVVAWKPFSDSPGVASARLRASLPCDYMRAAGWPCEMFDREDVGGYEPVIFQKASGEENADCAMLWCRRFSP